MNAISILARWSTPALVIALSGSVTAQPVRLFGPPAPGHARPPIWLFQGAGKPGGSSGGGHGGGGSGGGGGVTNPTPPPTAHTPHQIATAYGITTGTGGGQTIAIIEAYGDGSLSTDVSAFNSYFGLPPFAQNGPTLTVVSQAGTKPRSAGWALETAMDVEWAHAIAPQANILVVVAKDSSLGNLLSAVQYANSQSQSGVSVVSMSWGGSEFSTEADYDSYFVQPGVTYMASSGDSGEGVSWPAASPNVVSVGGTTLSLNPDDSYNSETAWSGSGGGISSYVLQPAFQDGFQSTGYRTTPDVSFDADPATGVAVYTQTKYNGQNGWFQVGGTSLGAPSWAGLIALVNQSRVAASQLLLGSGNSAIYALNTATAVNTSYFHDINSGNNGPDSDDFAIDGYDFVTGLGTPIAKQLIPNL